MHVLKVPKVPYWMEAYGKQTRKLHFRVVASGLWLVKDVTRE